MSNDFLHEIMCLAERVDADADAEAVQEWFFETPLWPHGKTARELVRAEQGAEVIAFLTRILHDAGAESTSCDHSSCPGAVSITLGPWRG